MVPRSQSYGGSSMENEKRVPVLYLDLDGTVRHGFDQLGRFVNAVADVVIFPEVPSLLLRYRAIGWRIAAVSNQGGVALGHMTMAQCCEAMMETNLRCGSAFDKMSWCVHHPHATDPEYAVCWCRKPRSGLIFESAHSMSIQHRTEIYPPHLALMVGDRPEDRGCAEGAGVAFMDAAEWRRGNHVARIEALTRP
jgi:D-glycero-D-manno-heptose 1,7-bisphosphate phosphatase